jgi:hypothetical protein
MDRKYSTVYRESALAYWPVNMLSDDVRTVTIWMQRHPFAHDMSYGNWVFGQLKTIRTGDLEER